MESDLIHTLTKLQQQLPLSVEFKENVQRDLKNKFLVGFHLKVLFLKFTESMRLFRTYLHVFT